MAQAQPKWKRAVLFYADEELCVLMPPKDNREQAMSALIHEGVELMFKEGIPFPDVINGGLLVPRAAIPLFEQRGVKFTVRDFTERRSSQPIEVQRELHI